jgi:hypothetical protein
MLTDDVIGEIEKKFLQSFQRQQRLLFLLLHPQISSLSKLMTGGSISGIFEKTSTGLAFEAPAATQEATQNLSYPSSLVHPAQDLSPFRDTESAPLHNLSSYCCRLNSVQVGDYYFQRFASSPSNGMVSFFSSSEMSSSPEVGIIEEVFSYRPAEESPSSNWVIIESFQAVEDNPFRMMPRIRAQIIDTTKGSKHIVSVGKIFPVIWAQWSQNQIVAIPLL